MSSNNRIERIAIVGAGGYIGKHIVAALLATGKHKVTALTRADSTSEMAPGLSVIKVDYADEASLVSALKGQQVLIITLAVTAARDTANALAAAAVNAGVALVMPNAWGGDLSSGNQRQLVTTPVGPKYKEEIEQIAKLSAAAGNKTAWTNISCSFWYEYSLGGGLVRYGFDLAGRKVIFFDDAGTGTAPRVVATTPAQVGRAVAALVSLPVERVGADAAAPAVVADWRNTSVRVQSFYLTQRDMLDSVQRVTNTADADWEVAAEPAEARYARGIEMLRGGDRLGFVIALYSQTFTKAWQWGDRGDDNKKLGLPVEDLDEATRRAVDFAQEAA